MYLKNETSTKHKAANGIKSMRSLPAEDVDSVIAMLKHHAYGKEEMDECGYDANKIEHLDAHAFDNAIMIELLGGTLDGEVRKAAKKWNMK